MNDTLWLLLAGIGAGLTGSVAGLASLISYPALLAFGLPPLAANVTNTVALFGVTGGTIAGSQRELRGQGRRAVRLAGISLVGGALGAALLLHTPEEAFEVVVPWLIAFGATLLLFRDRIRAWAARHSQPDRPATDGPVRAAAWTLVLLLLGVYGGYFGAGVGIIALAVLALERVEPLAVTNAVKNVATGAANGAAAIAYILFAPVDWPAAVSLAAGAVIGGLIGPSVVRVAPERPLRWLVAIAGLGLAVHLATS
ncbi:sulfite exporter TauE/SafE family protein [Nocardioides sambongensis]|uniref:sulfite exporter TauE/SafE family protein n=1 Tax=Nocardioides sambongensis TaxID=2589074 RepID=UPI0011268EAD|nr:sulfite exporter TauE/SafE family protein [Nocardioides sambongensis]